jgi:hypothetical protein
MRVPEMNFAFLDTPVSVATGVAEAARGRDLSRLLRALGLVYRPAFGNAETDQCSTSSTLS